jgi:hypothetical protein
MVVAWKREQWDWGTSGSDRNPRDLRDGGPLSPVHLNHPRIHDPPSTVRAAAFSGVAVSQAGQQDEGYSK